MRRFLRATLSVIVCMAICGSVAEVAGAPRAKAKKSKSTVNCPALHLNAKGDRPLAAVTLPPTEVCAPVKRNGFLLPDPDCTPGAINPALTVTVLHDRRFSTRCVRDKATSAGRKTDTYDWYHQNHPARNTGKTQVCELDHLISLELGGADTLDNIWPQCGPARVSLNNRFFKPVIKLPAEASEAEHLALLSLLNSSTACFWLRQVAHCKGAQGINEGHKSERWEQFFQFGTTKLGGFPLPVLTPRALATAMGSYVK